MSAANDGTAYTWHHVTSEAPFAPRDGAGALVFDDRMWLFGGWNPRDKVHFPTICNSEVWSSADGADWRLITPNAPWEGRHTAGYAVFAGRLWILGADAQNGRYQNDVWSSADGVRWERVCAEVPWKDRVLHHTVVHDGQIWVMGGQTMGKYVAGPDAFYNDVWSTRDGVRWRRVTAAAPWAPRGMIGGSAVFRGRMWVLGGGTYDTPATPTRRFFNDVWSSPDGVRWTRHLEHAPWAPRQYHDVAVYDDRLWVMEGWDGTGNRSDVHHSPDGVTWYELPETPWAPRHAASLFAHRDALWMVAGNNMTSDVWKLTRAQA
ncbi:MAG TPA: galactose oxidase [Chloroflexota bacterium]|nr:galactose oxidase [Chloroflexota bacterium]